MMLTTAPARLAPRQNQLLAALPEGEFAALQARLELVPMPLGWALYESGDSQGYAYFPTTCTVALLRTMEDGFSSGSAIVGNEGAVGVASFMGGESTPDRAVVLSAGFAYRMRSGELKNEFERNARLRGLLLRYTQALLTQTMQTAVCNRLHAIEQQLCRLLLLLLDRLPDGELTMTQELIGSMLGVRREGISAAAARLQAAGVIRYHRGHISVLDRSRLEAQACECYAVVKREYERLLPDACQGRTSPGVAAAEAGGMVLPSLLDVDRHNLVAP